MSRGPKGTTGTVSRPSKACVELGGTMQLVCGMQEVLTPEGQAVSVMRLGVWGCSVGCEAASALYADKEEGRGVP